MEECIVGIEEINTNQFSAIEEVFRYYYPRLRKYAYYMLGNEGEAEDLVQDVFFQLWREQKVTDWSKNISSYLFTILRNRCLNVYKRRLVENRYVISEKYSLQEELYSLSFENGDNFTSFDELLHQEILKLIESMPQKCSEAFRLKWIDGKKNREIAGIMGISMTMVDKHLAKGLRIAKEKLDPNLFLLFVIAGK